MLAGAKTLLIHVFSEISASLREISFLWLRAGFQSK